MSTTLSQRISRTLRQDVTSSAGYAIQPSAGMVKLDAMENPFGLPPALKRALGERLAEVAINRYPINKGEDELGTDSYRSGCASAASMSFISTKPCQCNPSTMGVLA